jgi:ankyrin repeat protein
VPIAHSLLLLVLTLQRFLLVRYQLDQIVSEDFPQDALNALEKLPTDLSEAYLAILERIKAKKGLDLAYLIFSCVFHMPRPIRMGELIEALSMQKGNPELNPKLFMSPTKLLRRCEGLITYDRMSDEVRFAHFTVFEYLEKYQENLSKKIELATISLKYFIMAAHKFREKEDIQRSEAFALEFLEPASRYWGCWAEQDADNLELWELLLQLHESPWILQKLHQFLQLRGAIGTISQCLCNRFTILHLLAVGNLARICEVIFDIACNEDLNRLPKPLINITDRISAMAKSCQTNIDHVCDEYGSALHRAAAKNDDQLFRLLISHQADFNVRERWTGQTPIHIAASSGSVSKLEFLHTQGADLDVLDKHGNAPLYGAILHGQTSCVEVLLAKGHAAPDWANQLIHPAAQFGNVEILQLFVKATPASVRSKDSLGRTPLHYASENGDARVLKLLLSLPEVDPSSKDVDGKTPLHFAVREWSHNEQTKLLLDAGTDYTVTDRYGYTPMDLALLTANTHVVQAIYNHSRTLNDSQGLAPGLSDLGEWEPVRYLLSRIDDNPEHVMYHQAVARAYLTEGNVEMAYQYFDRSIYISHKIKQLLPFSCPECRLFFNSYPRQFLCSSCPDQHKLCVRCFLLLSDHKPPKYFADHVFHQIPSQQYPASISDFIESFEARAPAIKQLSDTEVESSEEE